MCMIRYDITLKSTIARFCDPLAYTRLKLILDRIGRINIFYTDYWVFLLYFLPVLIL